MPKYLVANHNFVGGFNWAVWYDEPTDGNGKAKVCHYNKLLYEEDEKLSLDELILKFKHEVEDAGTKTLA